MNAEDNLIIPINYLLSYEEFENLMVSAIEGGMNYWGAFKRNLPEEIAEKYKGEPFSVKVSKAIWEHHTLEIEDVEESDGPWTINLDKVKEGLAKMASTYQHHFSNIVTENGDAETGDVFVQVCCMGEIIYA